MFDFQAKSVMPSFGFRFNDSAHYKGVFIKDDAPIHDVEHNPLTPSPEDSKAEVIAESFHSKQKRILDKSTINTQPNTMPNYQEGKMYKIYNAANDDIHVGSTT